jgi:hypothetical protein
LDAVNAIERVVVTKPQNGEYGQVSNMYHTQTGNNALMMPNGQVKYVAPLFDSKENESKQLMQS